LIRFFGGDGRPAAEPIRFCIAFGAAGIAGNFAAFPKRFSPQAHI
jgi:hypothetical protein